MKFTPLHAAAERGHLPTVQALLAAGADGGSADVDGATPLHHASAHGHVATVVALLRATSSPLAAENLFGDTALHWCALVHCCPPLHWLRHAACCLSQAPNPRRGGCRACAKGRVGVAELLLLPASAPSRSALSRLDQGS